MSRRDMNIETKRLYGGRTKDDRVAMRRQKLVEAAISLAAAGGRDAVMVSNVCAAAGLTSRYFYESFSSREQLFAEAFHVVSSRLLDAMRQASTAESAATSTITALFETLLQYPGEAQVFLVDVDGHEAALAQVRAEVASSLSRLILPDIKSKVARAGTLGALLAIGRQWVRDGFREPIEEIVALGCAFANAAGDQAHATGKSQN